MTEMEDVSVDVEAYFNRIGWRGSTEPAYSTLAGILDAHMSSIPLENVDVLLGRGVRLDLTSLQAKLVGARRGGYCFEHSSLLGAVLDRLGYAVVRRAARVVLLAPSTEAPRAHMFLTVTLPEGVFVVDPGFGGFGARFPVPLDAASTAENATHWMVRDGDRVTLRFRRGEETIDGWVAALDEVHHPIDFEVGNYFTATNPGSPFKSMLMMSLRTPDGAVNVMNRDVTVRRGEQAEDAARRTVARCARADRRAFRIRSPGDRDHAHPGRTRVECAELGRTGGRVERTPQGDF